MNVYDQLWAVTKALEVRFPDHNGPFEYGTRLAEETGELVEALYQINLLGWSDERREHVVKEQQDVLRITMGIARIYNISLPQILPSIATDTDTLSLLEHATFVGIASGELASAVNHVEGMGIKNEKHGDLGHRRVLEKAQKLIEAVLMIVQSFDLQDVFDRCAQTNYHNNKARGFIAE